MALSRKWGKSSSTFTFVGHKEDTLAKMISEKLATSLRRNIVVAIGIHWHGLTSKEIKRRGDKKGTLELESAFRVHLLINPYVHQGYFFLNSFQG